MNRTSTYNNLNETVPNLQKSSKYDKFWAGENQYSIYLKKKHTKLFSPYDEYWLVYGKNKNLYIFPYPYCDGFYFKDSIANIKYMTLNNTKIKLWNGRKKFNIRFNNEDEKLYFDQYYKKNVII